MIEIKTPTYIFFYLSFLFAQAYAGDQTQLSPNLKAGQEIYELCASCHYANGWGKEDGSFPVIAGQHPNVIKKQLADFRSRDRDNPTMFPFTDNEMLGGAQGIEDVTAYISQLPANPSVGHGDGKHLEKGKKLFTEHCAACHGKYGEGNNQALFPRLQGQHYAYILRQLKWIRDGHRKNANPVMLEQVKTMDDSTLAIIADYISRIAIITEETAQLPTSINTTKEETDAVTNKATKEKDEEPDCD